MFVNRIVSCLVLAFAASVVVAEEKTLIINDFENDADLKAVESGGAKLVGEGVTHGSKAMEIAGGGVSVTKPPRDWSAYDALILDVFNPADTPVKAEVMIGDKAWQDAPNKYWNRHNGFMTFGPG